MNNRARNDANMSRVTLQDYVRENKVKSESTSSLLSTAAGGAGVRLTNFANGFKFSRGGADDVSVDFGDETKPSSSSNGSSSRWSFLPAIGEDNAFGLSRVQRIVGFFVCLAMALFCFGFATLYIPVLVFKTRKFALLNTFGCVFLMFSFALLWGPKAYATHLFSATRLPVTCVYLLSVAATLYTSLWVCPGLFLQFASSVFFI